MNTSTIVNVIAVRQLIRYEVETRNVIPARLALLAPCDSSLLIGLRRGW